MTTRTVLRRRRRGSLTRIYKTLCTPTHPTPPHPHPTPPHPTTHRMIRVGVVWWWWLDHAAFFVSAKGLLTLVAALALTIGGTSFAAFLALG